MEGPCFCTLLRTFLQGFVVVWPNAKLCNCNHANQAKFDQFSRFAFVYKYGDFIYAAGLDRLRRYDDIEDFRLPMLGCDILVYVIV